MNILISKYIEYKCLLDYHEQLYVNKLNILEEMDKYLETHNLPGLNHK